MAVAAEGALVRHLVRNLGRTFADSAMDSEMDGQSAAAYVPGAARFRFQRIRARACQRAGIAGSVAGIPGSHSLSRRQWSVSSGQ